MKIEIETETETNHLSFGYRKIFINFFIIMLCMWDVMEEQTEKKIQTSFTVLLDHLLFASVFPNIILPFDIATQE